MEDVYVIWWKYGDGSGCGVMRAYADRQRAEEDLELLVFDSNRQFEIAELPVYRDGSAVQRATERLAALSNGQREGDL